MIWGRHPNNTFCCPSRDCIRRNWRDMWFTEGKLQKQCICREIKAGFPLPACYLPPPLAQGMGVFQHCCAWGGGRKEGKGNGRMLMFQTDQSLVSPSVTWESWFTWLWELFFDRNVGNLRSARHQRGISILTLSLRAIHAKVSGAKEHMTGSMIGNMKCQADFKICPNGFLNIFRNFSFSS